MADVTINELTRGVPAGGNILPYSTGSNTLGVPVSAILQDAGNIGIGNNSPQSKLHVYDASNSLIALGRAGNPQALAKWEYNSGTCSFGTRDTDNLELITNNVSRLFMNTVGNVGIGTTTPTAKLDVNGNVKATNIPKFAWARFNGSGEIQASLGVTSITPNSPNSNVYIVDVTAANFSNANYSITGMTRYNGTSCFMQLYTGDGSSTAFNPTTTRFYVATNNSSVGQVNHTNYIQVMGN